MPSFKRDLNNKQERMCAFCFVVCIRSPFFAQDELAKLVALRDGMRRNEIIDDYGEFEKENKCRNNNKNRDEKDFLVMIKRVRTGMTHIEIMM